MSMSETNKSEFYGRARGEWIALSEALLIFPRIFRQ